MPIWVIGFYQFVFPRSAPSLEPFFSRYGIVYLIIVFDIDEPEYPVFVDVTASSSFAVFNDAFDQIVRDSNIDWAEGTRCEDIN